MKDELAQLPSPCYLLEEARLKQNLALIDRVAGESGCRFLLALKVCLTAGTSGITMIFDEIDRG